MTTDNAPTSESCPHCDRLSAYGIACRKHVEKEQPTLPVTGNCAQIRWHGLTAWAAGFHDRKAA